VDIGGEEGENTMTAHSIPSDWRLNIIPDNLVEFRVQTVKRTQNVVFYARVLGIGEGRYVR
jgi:hypothetical protein